MLDIDLIREDSEKVKKNIERRHDKEKMKLLKKVMKLDKKWREYVDKVNKLRAKRNEISETISELKKEEKEEKAEEKIKEASKLANKIEKAEDKMEEYDIELKKGLMNLPNMLHESVPYGEDEHNNVEIRKWGSPPEFDFEPKSHVEILEDLGLADFERAGKISGSGFVYLKGKMVMLDMAIQRFAIDFLREKGFTLIEPPFMIRRKAYEGVTDLGDFESVMYKINGDDLYLIATSEHPMGAMFMNEILDKSVLPIKLAGVSPCFRREVGTHGKYTKGLYRMHQFNKIEQFIFCLPEQSWELHEKIQENSEKLYQSIGLHYRVVNVCTGDIGSIASKKYDTEVWMADGNFREIGSNSNCTGYQARRLKTRYREGEGKPVKGVVHTLNNTALATSRTMMAILEQFQQKDGTVIVPEVLRPYMNGIEILD